eukprot:2469884-Amphidinium_carterae.1
MKVATVHLWNLPCSECSVQKKVGVHFLTCVRWWKLGLFKSGRIRRSACCTVELTIVSDESRLVAKHTMMMKRVAVAECQVFLRACSMNHAANLARGKGNDVGSLNKADLMRKPIATSPALQVTR